MPTITTKDGVTIFYKDWGTGQPIVFSHGWPLSADDWDNQMMFFLNHGYRVIAHDRRGHGRSSQVDTGHDMDHYAADACGAYRASRPEECHPRWPFDGRRRSDTLRRTPRPRQNRVAKAVLISAVPPLMLKTPANPGRHADRGVRRLPRTLAANRAQFYMDLPTGPFYGFNRPGAKAPKASSKIGGGRA